MRHSLHDAHKDVFVQMRRIELDQVDQNVKVGGEQIGLRNGWDPEQHKLANLWEEESQLGHHSFKSDLGPTFSSKFVISFPLSVRVSSSSRR